MIQPIGEPLALRRGAVEARIGTVAATLRSLTVNGAHLTQPTPDDREPASSNGIVLAPWPNRVADARWTWRESVQQLDVTEPERGNALHGLLRFTDYVVRDRADDAVTLAATVYPQHGWPFLLETWVRYALLDDGIEVAHGVTNHAADPAPYATGAHPFLRVGDAPIAELALIVPAARYVTVDDRLNPTGLAPVDGTPADLREGPRVAGLELDTAFGGIAFTDVVDGRGTSATLVAPDGSRTILRQDLTWDWVQVYTTHEFHDASGDIDAIAVEPMTAPPDALNSGTGLEWIDPGASWTGGWELRRAEA
ncbi:aldose 1-epimerase family protein [Pseudolysinimonas sp.]|uniref:aldose 1-epimerase family protein n=1 Tax=Pseudolysinimonas sp. TaxID=2680009 RepID=UPI003F81D245